MSEAAQAHIVDILQGKSARESCFVKKEAKKAKRKQNGEKDHMRISRQRERESEKGWNQKEKWEILGFPMHAE